MALKEVLSAIYCCVLGKGRGKSSLSAEPMSEYNSDAIDEEKAATSRYNRRKAFQRGVPFVVIWRREITRRAEPLACGMNSKSGTDYRLIQYVKEHLLLVVSGIFCKGKA